jgi:hypothetical protein
MAQIESKHDVRRKVRDAQAQVNRERLKRESDNREDMVAFLVAEQKLSAVSEWEAEQRRAEQLANAKKLRIWLGSALTNPSATQVGSRLA